MSQWRREIVNDLNRKANEPCTCENNGDYCPRCDARAELTKYWPNNQNDAFGGNCNG
jgi:hypothetical protein